MCITVSLYIYNCKYSHHLPIICEFPALIAWSGATSATNAAATRSFLNGHRGGCRE